MKQKLEERINKNLNDLLDLIQELDSEAYDLSNAVGEANTILGELEQ